MKQYQLESVISIIRHSTMGCPDFAKELCEAVTGLVITNQQLVQEIKKLQTPVEPIGDIDTENAKLEATKPTLISRIIPKGGK